jgi:hypothetical protein
MKTTKTFLQLVVTVIIFTLFGHLSAQSQYSKWIVAPNAVDFLTTTPTVVSSVSPHAVNNDEYNSICDNAGNIVFYIAFGNIYNKNHVIIGSLTTRFTHTEISIVPNPDPCTNKYYIIYPHQIQPPQALVGSMAYGIVDMNANSGAGSYTLITTNIGGMSPLGNNVNPIAVSRVNANGKRYLYYNATGMPIFEISSTSITYTGGNVSAPTIIGVTEMELSNAGDKLIFSTQSSGPHVIHVVPLNPATGQVAGPSVTYNTGVIGAINGLELDNSGRWLFFTKGTTAGVQVQDLLNTSFAPFSVAGTSAFSNSMLEKSFNGNEIICASNTQIRGINPITFILNSWTQSIVLPQGFNGVNTVRLMPDQIDGENYDSGIPVGFISIASSSTGGCAGSSVTLTAFSAGSSSYTWQPGNLSGSVVTVNPSVSTTYTVTASNSGGCSATSTMLVTVKCCGPNSVIFDNVTLVAPGTTLGATPWFTVAIGNTYTGNVEVPPGGTMFSATYSIWGSFTLNNTAGTTTFFGSEVIFDEAVQFTQLTPMTIDKSWFHACDKMWQGISSREYLKITNSIIEDANSAVGIGFITAHPGLLVDNTLFNRNQNGIVALFATVNTSSPNNFKITGSIFTCKGGFPPGTYTLPIASTFTTSLIGTNNIVSGFFTTIKGSPIMSIPIKRSEYGIAIAGASVTQGNFFNIGSSSSNSITNSRLRNYFSYLNTGILNGGSKIDVVNCNFQQIVNFQGNIANAGIHHSSGTPPNTITFVGDLNSLDKKCTFQNSQTGIKANGGGVLDASNNLFQTIIGNGIDVSTWNNSTGTVDVRQNTFTGCNTDFFAFNNSSIKAVIQGNSSTGSTLSPYNVNIQELTSANTALYRIDGNVFTGKLNGIYLNNINNANVTDNTIKIGQNVSTTIYSANIWCLNSLNCLFGNNILSSVSGNANKNSWQVFGIFTSMSTGNTYCSNDISEVGNSFKFQGYCVPSNVYSNTLDKGIVGIMLDATGNTGHIGASSGSVWYAGENCFGNFTGAETYCQGGSNSPQANIYYNGSGCYFPSPNLASGANTFIPVSTSLMPGGPICPSATFRMISDSTHYDFSSSLQLENRDGMSYIGKKETFYLIRMFEEYQNVQAPEFMEDCENSNIGRFFDVDSLTHDFVTTRNQVSLQNAQNLSGGITPVNIIEQNQLAFNDIYFAYLSSDSTAVLPLLNDLRELATKCPYTDGNAVYQSRALLSKFDETVYFNSCEYNAPTLKTQVMDAGPTSDLLYPNPASHEVFVNASDEGLTVEIYSVLGVKVAAYTLYAGENKLDVRGLASGTYFFKIIGNDDMKVYKLEIIK